MPRPSPRAAGLLLSISAIVGVAVLLYADTLDAPYVLDDVRNIAGNPAIQWRELSLSNLRRAALESPTPRAVANVSFALNHYFGGKDGRGYRAVNIAIHAGNGLLVYALALATYRRATASSRGSPAALRDEGTARAIALFAALLFVSHPLQTQSVTYLVQRMNSLAATFYLGALLLYVRGRETSIRSERVALFCGTGLLWGLATGSKENAVVLPFAVWSYEWYFFRDLSRSFLRRSLPVLLAGGVAIAILLALHPEGLARFEGRGFSPVERLLTQLRVVWLYLGLVLLPLPSRLNLIYDVPISHTLLDPPSTLAALLGLVVLLVGAAVLAPRNRIASFGIVWFLLHLAFESSLIPLAMAFEHRTYLPMVGVAIAAPLAVCWILPRRTLAAALCAAVLLLLGIGTHLRNQVWRDGIRLWSDVVAKSPGSARAHDELGLALAGAGRLEEASRHYRTAMTLDPPKPEPHLHLGYTLVQLGDLDAGMPLMQEALALDPENHPAHHVIGLTLLEQGRILEAATHLARAAALDSENATYRNSLGVLEGRRGRTEVARRHYAEALRLDPLYVKSHVNLGALSAREGQQARAIDHFDRALRLDPASLSARNNLAWLLATAADPTLRRPERAVALAEAARDASQEDDPELLDTLAAAYAATGRDDDAVRTATGAIAAAEAKGDATLADEIRARRHLYERGQAYVDPAPLP